MPKSTGVSLQAYAHVVDGKVVSMSIWDGVQTYTPPDGASMVQAPHYVDDDGQIRATVGIGWDWVDGEFVDNRPAETSEQDDGAMFDVASDGRIAVLEAQVAALLAKLGEDV